MITFIEIAYITLNWILFNIKRINSREDKVSLTVKYKYQEELHNGDW